MKGTEVKAKLRGVVGANPNLPIQAKVVAVQNETCTVELVSGLQIEDVRLKASVNNKSNYLLVRPAVGSTVLLLSITGGLEDLAVLQVDEVKNIELKQNGLSILADAEDGRVQIENASVGLKEIFEDLSALLKAFKVFTPAGPSGTPLPNVLLKINAFESKIKQLLK